MRELIFEVTQEADGGYWAECLTETIVTEGDTWEELRQNVREVVRAFYFDQPDRLPTTLRLHLVRESAWLGLRRAGRDRTLTIRDTRTRPSAWQQSCWLYP